VQNASLVDDEFRTLNPGARPVSMSTLIADTRNTSTQSVEGSSSKLVNVINNSMFYDCVGDRILRGSDLDPNNTWVVTPGNSQLGVPSSFTPQTIRSIPRNAMVVVKGIGVSNKGGELLPIVATPINMTYIFKALGPAQAIARGELSHTDGRPIVQYDIMAALTAPERENLQRLLAGPTYTNPTIELILQSFKRQSAAPSNLERSVALIGKRLGKVIPEEKAINVSSGSLVNAVSPCYNVVELQVQPPGSNEYRIVKFAFHTTNLKEEGRQSYMNLLRERFKARPVQSTEVSVEQRRTISLQPVRASITDYPNLFRSSESFQSYIRRINEATSSQVVDVSQVLHGETGSEEEEYIEEYEEELDEY